MQRKEPAEVFQRELDLASSWGARVLRHLEAAAQAPRIDDVSKHLNSALDAAWRMESALGVFLAIEPQKMRAAKVAEAAEAAQRAFNTLKPALASADERRRSSEAGMKAWIDQFSPQADQAVIAANRAREKMPPLSSYRIKAPIGEASPDQARAVVSIARMRRRDLSVDDVVALVRQALEPLGRIERFVKAGQTVLLKPNQTLFMLADEGATTDPRLVAALAHLSYQAGASKVTVGESSGGGSNSDYVMHVTGVKMMAQRAGAEVVDFQTCPQRRVTLPNGKVIKQILLPVPLLDADVIVNLPKMKTHNWDWISGALKNWVGILRPDVREQHHDAQTYDEYIDLLFRVPPQLNVMDAIVRGEGNGPGANQPQFYGGILASTDPVAMDAVAAQILGFDPAAIGFVQVAEERGLGVGDPGEIAVVGVPLFQAFQPARPPLMGVDIFDANVIVGMGLTGAGTLGHFKSMGDIFQAMGTWELVRRLHGRPTILIGNAEDPLFSDHLREGPYLVIDDAAPEKYKHHPDVFLIPGHPVLHNLESQLLAGLRIPRLGSFALQAMGKTRLADTRLEFNVPPSVSPLVRAALDATRALPVPAQVALTLGAAGLLLAGTLLGLRRLGDS